MNSQQIYNQWLQSKQQQTTSEDFADTVLNRITTPKRRLNLPALSSELILDWISARLPLKTAVVTAGGFGGALRIAALIYFLLFA